MRIAVLYDGDGSARQTLEAAGHDCVGFDLVKGPGRSVAKDPKEVDLDAYDGIWVNGDHAWAFDIEIRPLWINGKEIK